jgi:UDP-glucuronate 4-epimerase
VRVLVTGGAGFIGSHVSEAFLREGHQVAIVDDLNDFYSPSLKEENLASVRSTGQITFHQADICDESAVRDIFKESRPELVVHLAARAGVRPSLQRPLLYEHVNIRGTQVLLEECRLQGVRRLLLASSSSVYGSSNRVPFSEEDQVNRPISPYAATKLACENIAYTYSHLYGIQTMCLRFFTVYGPRQRPDLAIRKFTDLIARGQPIQVYGDGTSSRDYTFIDDIVDGVLAAARFDAPYEIFNLGNSNPIGLVRLIQAIETALGREAEIRWLSDQPGDVPITCADITKGTRLLGYHPKVTFPEGIHRFVDWYRRSEALRCVT